MKLKEGFVLKTVGDNHIVVPVGAQTVDFRSMITLNETGMSGSFEPFAVIVTSYMYEQFRDIPGAGLSLFMSIGQYQSSP